MGHGDQRSPQNDILLTKLSHGGGDGRSAFDGSKTLCFAWIGGWMGVTYRPQVPMATKLKKNSPKNHKNLRRNTELSTSSFNLLTSPAPPSPPTLCRSLRIRTTAVVVVVYILTCIVCLSSWLSIAEAICLSSATVLCQGRAGGGGVRRNPMPGSVTEAAVPDFVSIFSECFPISGDDVIDRIGLWSSSITSNVQTKIKKKERNGFPLRCL